MIDAEDLASRVTDPWLRQAAEEVLKALLEDPRISVVLGDWLLHVQRESYDTWVPRAKAAAAEHDEELPTPARPLTYPVEPGGIAETLAEAEALLAVREYGPSPVEQVLPMLHNAGDAIDAVGLDRDAKCRRCGWTPTWVFGIIDADGRRGAVVCHTPGAGPGASCSPPRSCIAWKEPPTPPQGQKAAQAGQS